MKMVLPHHNDNRPRCGEYKWKICQDETCGREFWGHHVAKYCELCRTPRMRAIRRARIKKRREAAHNDKVNMEFKHSFYEVNESEFTCKLDGCNNKYRVKIFPKQFIYPRYCEEHRNEHKRNIFLRQLKKVA